MEGRDGSGVCREGKSGESRGGQEREGLGNGRREGFDVGVEARESEKE